MGLYHGILYYRPTHRATEARTGGQLKNLWFSEILEENCQPLLRILRITFWFTLKDNRTCGKLNKWEYVFLFGTLIIIKQHKGVIMISCKRYNTHNIESEIFILFTGVTEPFIQSIPCEWIKSLV